MCRGHKGVGHKGVGGDDEGVDGEGRGVGSGGGGVGGVAKVLEVSAARTEVSCAHGSQRCR